MHKNAPEQSLPGLHRGSAHPPAPSGKILFRRLCTDARRLLPCRAAHIPALPIHPG